MHDALEQCLDVMQSPSSIQCDSLHGRQTPLTTEYLLMAFGPSASTGSKSKAAVNHYGGIHKNDVVFWKCDGEDQVATVLCFEEVVFVSGARVLQALVYIHRKSGPMKWQLNEGPTSTRIDLKGLRTVPYMKIRNTIHVIFPAL